VKVVSLHFEPAVEIASTLEGETVEVQLAGDLNPGVPVTADILVEDEHGNTLNVLVPFRARNTRLPDLLITELRTKHTKPKADFVELKVLKAGNLGALRLFTAGSGLKTPVFEFPPAEVAQGEYIVVHLRSWEEGLVNETGTDLSASSGTDSSPRARDFWIAGSKELLRETDAVFLMDQDDKVLDAVLLSESAEGGWLKPELASAAELLASEGAWKYAGDMPLPADAVPSTGTTTTRSISRNEQSADSNSPADWYITATSNATPGKPNSQLRWVASASNLRSAPAR
jgi:hypothetical protein